MIASLSICDVVPLSYGIETLGNIFSVIIPRNHPYPLNKIKYGFITIEDHQTAARFSVFQGERPLCVDNHFLGEFVVRNLPSKWAGDVTFYVTMKIDENGILEVSATEQSTGIRKSIEIKDANGKLYDTQISEFISKAEIMKRNDENLKETVEARNKLQLFAYELRHFANEDYPRKFHNENTRRIVKSIAVVKQ
ncbi:hypothetical protein B4U80_02355 [Leptotrombidium deliense]|uniref:Uncharacterized protein n=1 Tax=Leptotrombidium deliense TaxID=299467 RepID=A0A443S2S3_9ACAR|nr:hypothetical protein B4U80_02355 [Leptotrombidium deliense]